MEIAPVLRDSTGNVVYISNKWFIIQSTQSRESLSTFDDN